MAATFSTHRRETPSPAISGESQAGEVVAIIVFEHPLEVEHGRNLAQDLHLMLGDGAQRTASIKDLQQDSRASTEEGAHQCLRLAAYMRRRQIDQSASAAVSAKKCAAQAHILHRNITVQNMC